MCLTSYKFSFVTNAGECRMCKDKRHCTCTTELRPRGLIVFVAWMWFGTSDFGSTGNPMRHSSEAWLCGSCNPGWYLHLHLLLYISGLEVHVILAGIYFYISLPQSWATKPAAQAFEKDSSKSERWNACASGRQL